MPRVIHTAQALVDAVMEVPVLPVSRRQRHGHLVPPVRRRSGHDPARRGPVGGALRARRRGRHRAERRPRPGRAGGRGDRGVLAAGARRRHRASASCSSSPRPSASFVTTQGAERRISVESLAASCAGAPVTWSASAATRSSGAPATRSSRGSTPSTPASSSCSTPGRPSPSSTPRCATACSPARRCGPATPTRRPRSPGCTACTRRTEVVATLLAPDAVTIVRDGPRGCAVREGGTTTSFRDTRSGRSTPTEPATRTPGCCSPSGPRGLVVDPRRGARQRRRRHQGHPARAGHRADPGGDRRLPRRLTPATAASRPTVGVSGDNGS